MSVHSNIEQQVLWCAVWCLAHREIDGQRCDLPWKRQLLDSMYGLVAAHSHHMVMEITWLWSLRVVNLFISLVDHTSIL